MQATLDTRTGSHSHERIDDAIDRAAALEWLAELDGTTHTLLSLTRDDSRALMLGGGPDRFIVVLTADGDDRTLANPGADPSVTVELCAGGQSAEFPESICVDRDRAASVIELFFCGRELDTEWV